LNLFKGLLVWTDPFIEILMRVADIIFAVTRSRSVVTFFLFLRILMSLCLEMQIFLKSSVENFIEDFMKFIYGPVNGTIIM